MNTFKKITPFFVGAITIFVFVNVLGKEEICVPHTQATTDDCKSALALANQSSASKTCGRCYRAGGSREIAAHKFGIYYDSNNNGYVRGYCSHIAYSQTPRDTKMLCSKIVDAYKNKRTLHNNDGRLVIW